MGRTSSTFRLGLALVAQGSGRLSKHSGTEPPLQYRVAMATRLVKCPLISPIAIECVEGRGSEREREGTGGRGSQQLISCTGELATGELATGELATGVVNH